VISNRGLARFDTTKYGAMAVYVQNPFNTMDQEIHANQFLIDVIHEAVLNYFPEEGAVSDTTDEADKAIVENARTNLQTSLQGYRGTRKEYIETPSITPKDVDTMSNELKNKKIPIPNVSHMEAIAELYRHAILMVNPDDKANLIKDAKIVAPVTTTTQSTAINEESEYKTFLAGYLSVNESVIKYVAPYYEVNKKKYLVFKDTTKFEVAEMFEMNNANKKTTESAPASLPNIGKDPIFDYSKVLSIDSVDEIVKELLTCMGIDIPTAYSDVLTLYARINNEYQVTVAIGDGNCLYHSFLHLSKTYRMCDDPTKRKLAVLFRINLAKNLRIIINKIQEKNLKEFFEEQFKEEQKMVGWPKWDNNASEPTYNEAFKLYPTDWVELDHGMAYNYLMFAFPIIFVTKTGNKFTDFQPTESISDTTNTYIYLWNTNGDVHFNIVTTTGNDPSPILIPATTIGGTNKKAKTRKPRIFKKWKSRRRRM
jgi:hypothetical protein